MNTSVSDLIDQIKINGPSAKHRDWRSVDAPNCRAVQGLQIFQAKIILPDDLQIERPSSPIIEVDEAHEIYAQIAPNTADEGILRPLLHRVIFQNDNGSQQSSLVAMWLLFESIARFDELRLRPDEVSPDYCKNGGQAVVGRQRLYITNRVSFDPLVLDRALFGAALNQSQLAEVLHARSDDPAKWSEDHAAWPNSSQKDLEAAALT